MFRDKALLKGEDEDSHVPQVAVLIHLWSCKCGLPSMPSHISSSLPPASFFSPTPLAESCSRLPGSTQTVLHGSFPAHLLIQAPTECMLGVCVSMCAKLFQWCLTLCDPMDCGLPGSSVHGIFQATGGGSHSLLQGTAVIQGSNPGLLCLLHCRRILYSWAIGETPCENTCLIFSLAGMEAMRNYQLYPTSWLAYPQHPYGDWHVC